MKKFNEYENFLIKEAMKLLEVEMVNEIKDAEKKGKRHLFHVSYPPLVIKELIQKADILTKFSTK